MSKEENSSESGLEESEQEEEENGVPRTGKKRANHNELERKRRFQQKTKLLDLKEMIPILQGDKPSAIQILIKAKEYIEELHRRSNQLEDLLTLIKKGDLKSIPSVTSSTLTPSSKSTTPAVKKEKEEKEKAKGKTKVKIDETYEMDALKKENLELKAMIAEVQKKIDNLSKIREFSPAPNLQQMVIPSSKSQPNKEGSAEAKTEPVLTQTEPTIPMSYRKRKSRADNDFEAAKREYYERRNSVVEVMRDHQQRITEVGLLQNFAIQARRASLPTSSLSLSLPIIEEDSLNQSNYYEE